MSFNYDEEEICGYKVTAEMKKLWAVEMDIAQIQHNHRNKIIFDNL